MNTTQKRANRYLIPLSDSILVFVFFSAGVLAAFFCTLRMPWQESPRFFLAALLTGTMFVSVSAWGTVLLPFEAFAFGFFMERSAEFTVLPGKTLLEQDWSNIICAALLVPIFFLSSAHGMSGSAALSSALSRGGPSAREHFHRELAAVSILTLLGLACVFYFY